MNTLNMGSITVEQAIFSSSDRGRVKGYQLVSKSAGIDRATAQELCRWSPTQAPSDDPDKWTINCYPVSQQSVAITRTVLGGPEYSGRGGTQVVTLILVLSNQQLASYDHNPIALARTAMLMGHLRLPLEISCDQISNVTLPSGPVVDTSLSSDFRSDRAETLVEVAELLENARRVAVIGMDEPIKAVERLIPRLSQSTRRNLSFTTGLSPTIRRPFQVHFLSTADAPRQRTLDAQEIVRINAC